MKKVVLGAAMFLAGLLSDAVLLSGTMAHDWTLDGNLSARWNLSQYGLMPAFYLAAVIAAAGLTLAVWGLFEKN